MKARHVYRESRENMKKERRTILIADDSKMNRMMLAGILGDDFDILEADNGTDAIELIRKNRLTLSLVLLDIVMPEMDGFEVLVMMNRYCWIETIPVIMISGETADSYIKKSYELGASDYISRPFDSTIVKRRVMNIHMLYMRQRKLAALAVDQIYEREKISSLMVNVLSHIVEQRNGESGMHVLHISIMTEILANALIQMTDKYPLSKEEIEILCSSSPLHDIGKIAIPEEILNKPGRLTADEYAVMKQHSILGADMLENLPFYQDEPMVRVAYEVCRWHHERYDGKGYPDGLTGDEIPITAQIVSLADVYDALISKRVYKDAVSHETAVNMILGGECGCFNPILIQSFLSVQEKIKKQLSVKSPVKQKNRDVEKTVNVIRRHKELYGQEHTLHMLEYEQTKLRFYNATSRDIAFELMHFPSMLVVSDRDAQRLGINAVTMEPLKNKTILNIIGAENMDRLKAQFDQATPDEPILKLDADVKIGGREKRHRILCLTIWEGNSQSCLGLVGKLIDIEELKPEEVQRLVLEDDIGNKQESFAERT